MVKQVTKPKVKHNSSLSIAVVLIIALACGLLGYLVGSSHVNNDTATLTANRPGYIISAQASDQVAVFYQNYINPRNPAAIRRKLVTMSGSKNLVFYETYYQHGFDPIVCSSAMPSKITITKVTPGPVAIVEVSERYADNSSQDLTATVVINDDGLKIDSITCQGDKGNLPPVS